MRLDKRYKKRKYFRINQNELVQFSDTYNRLLGYTMLVSDYPKMFKQLKRMK